MLQEFGAGQNEKQKHATEVEEIICQLKGLQISNSARAVVREGKTALVPYKADGTIVPHEEFNPIRRRKPRPKVDLDPETNRLWDLLMVKPVSESTETMDKDKELWWEDQRKVFRGRVDSFIARMHLLQGTKISQISLLSICRMMWLLKHHLRHLLSVILHLLNMSPVQFCVA